MNWSRIHSKTSYATWRRPRAALAALALSLCAIFDATAEQAKAAQAEPVRIDATINRETPTYRPGERIEIEFSLIDVSQDKRAAFMDCELFVNGESVERKTLPSAAKCDFSITAPEDAAWIAAKATACGKDKKPLLKEFSKNPFDKVVMAGIGAMVAPELLKPSAPEPQDFDAFWKARRAELDKVPVVATRSPVDFDGPLKDKIDCYDVKVECAGGSPVSGYLGIPRDAAPKSLPAVVFFDGAGVRSATKPLWYQGAIAFHTNAHGIENGKAPDYYSELEKGRLKNYKFQGKSDRDAFYFKGMLLRAMRALDYVKSLPEWDGSTLLVFGGSMGGGQALAAAALDPQVTTCLAFIPAFGDQTATLAGRPAAYPRAADRKDPKELFDATLECAGYYDTVNFAKRIKADVILSTGLIDFICPPSSVYLVYNALPPGRSKKIVAYPAKGHEYYTPPEAKAVLENLYRKNAN